MGPQLDPDQRVAALAARQHGVVTRAQLTAAGLGPRAIARRIPRGRLHRVHLGVYAVGHVALPREGRRLAALLACGDGAALSHATAADVWGLRRSDAATVDVTVGRSGRSAPRGVRLHRRRAVTTTRIGALRVTTVAQTLLDLAALLPQRALERALAEAEANHLDVAGLPGLLAAHPRRHGAPRLRAALRAHRGDPATLTRSQLEERFLALCDDHRIPRPAVNRRVAGHEVDFSWAAERLIVEADGFRHHRSRAAFERDRRRDAALAARGWIVVRVTHRRLSAEPAAVAAEIRAVLTRR